jgi:hypothetical protein
MKRALVRDLSCLFLLWLATLAYAQSAALTFPNPGKACWFGMMATSFWRAAVYCEFLP